MAGPMLAAQLMIPIASDKVIDELPELPDGYFSADVCGHHLVPNSPIRRVLLNGILLFQNVSEQNKKRNRQKDSRHKQDNTVSRPCCVSHRLFSRRPTVPFLPNLKFPDMTRRLEFMNTAVPAGNTRRRARNSPVRIQRTFPRRQELLRSRTRHIGIWNRNSTVLVRKETSYCVKTGQGIGFSFSKIARDPHDLIMVAIHHPKDFSVHLAFLGLPVPILPYL